MHARRRTLAAVIALLAFGCGDPSPQFEKLSLSPGANPFGPDDDLWAEQPERDHPLSLALSHDGAKLYVTLQGVEDEPGSEVAVVDTQTEQVLGRIGVGASPTRAILHPDGRFLVVTNQYSNYASVIDTTRDRVVTEIEVPYYTIDLVFTPDGRRAYLSNRWKDSVLVWELEVGGEFRVRADNYSGRALEGPMGIPVGDNPRDIVISPDGERIYVASPTSLSLSIIDVAAEEEIRRVDLMSPPGDVLVTDRFVFLSHTGRGTHHPPNEGRDTDSDGEPGDGTANVMFQDLQNELAVLDHSGEWLHNYTSDSICCSDYRDVDPDSPTRGEALPSPDTWPSSRVAFLPPPETWIVACALPEQLAITGDRLFAVCSGSNEVQSFDVGSDGGLSAREEAGALFRTGMNPFDMVVAPDGSTAYVAERLGEHVTVLDLEAGPGSERRILVGNIDGGEYPATDAEIGTAINFVTAPFTIDGDQTCVHCHREGGNLAKPVAMPLQADTVFGVRMQMAYRGASDTRPWFMESSMAEDNFFPVINEFGRKENFCCEQLDTLIWSAYPSLSECGANSELEGCNHVLNCSSDPPPECAERGYGSPHLSRREHLLAGAMALFGRDRTYGDALFEEFLEDDGSISRRGIAIDFSGVTRAIGLFLLVEPRLPPNPYAALDLPAARRGKLIFESPATGCASCHPLPTTAISSDHNPLGLPLVFPPLITPRDNPNSDVSADLVNPLFLGTFPETVQDRAGIYFGVPQLRGIWDRAQRFLHDGRARNLREALATPYHPALLPGETGFNETFGMPDTHGATSHLSPRDLEDLIAFLLTL